MRIVRDCPLRCEDSASRLTRRRGMTLLEVLLALAIFLFALVAISQLFNTATDQAQDIQFQSRATRLAQSKLNEYVAGVRSLDGGGGEGTFDEEPEWDWRADAQADGTAQNLYRVTVVVGRDTQRGRIETTLTQYVLNPRSKGSIGTTTSSTTDSSTSTDTSSSTSGSTSGTSTATSGSGTNTGGSTGGR